MENLLVTRQEAAGALRICLRTVDLMISRGDLRVRRIGRRVLIPSTEVRRLAAGEQPATHQSGVTSARATA